jgi:3'-phosphoadenosine 5'-phosphosulfate sulfotransferase (PAPS reductase)/FAD synthetase
MSRTVVWFSAGASSAVAAKIMLSRGPAIIVYTDPGSEHPDNARFIDDCERWFDHEVLRLTGKYRDTWQVWEERRFLVGPKGALCTAELKRKVRFAFERPTDRQVFGYTVEESARADRFRDQNPGVDLVTPLIEMGLTKPDCLAMIERADIELPAMYKLGYDHNNCVGCVKGGMGYWNKIRVDFPETFNRMATLERTLGRTVIRVKGVPTWLDELDPERGNFNTEPNIECSLLCEIAEVSYKVVQPEEKEN